MVLPDKRSTKNPSYTLPYPKPVILDMYQDVEPPSALKDNFYENLNLCGVHVLSLDTFLVLHRNPANARAYLATLDLKAKVIYYQIVLPPFYVVRHKTITVFTRGGGYLLSGNQINEMFYTERNFMSIFSFPSPGK
jgi:hypothetical protein